MQDSGAGRVFLTETVRHNIKIANCVNMQQAEVKLEIGEPHNIFINGRIHMADFYINIFMNDEKQKKLDAAGLSDQIKEVGGKKAIQVEVSAKEQKKLIKGFPDLVFDASNACVIPEAAETTLLDIICNMKTIDVMKVAIMKIYSPLAGKAPRSAMR
jgi:hypothetical protein